MKNRDYPLYDPPAASCLASMLEANAREIPEKTAIRQRVGRDSFEEISHAQFYEDVKRVAAYINSTYGTGNHIAVLGENSYEWLLAFLGIVTSGNVAVPTDKDLPADEVHVLLKTAEVTAAFVAGLYADLVEGMEQLKVMTLKELRDTSVNASGYRLRRPDRDDLAAIFFTSGTTGRSKGVMLSHGNITEEINRVSRLFDPEGDMTVSMLPFNHAFGLVVAVLMAVNYRVTVFITKSLKTVQKDIKDNSPSIIMVVPLFVETFYKSILAAVRAKGKENQMKRGIQISNALLKLGIDRRRELFKDVLEPFGGNLKWIICGGAPLDPFYVRAFRDIGINILNGYGTTECSPCVAVNRNYFFKDGSVGQLAPGIEARRAEDGEVEIKGPIVMKGYYNDPQATAEVLPASGWYRTGDLGYVDADRFIFLTGRKKNLIILSNGENISPEEIEADFQIDEAVREVLVYVSDGKLIAEIYPEEAFLGREDYFKDLMLRVNAGRPLSKQIVSVKLRDEEFIKNTTKKIIRSKNVPAKQA